MRNGNTRISSKNRLLSNRRVEILIYIGVISTSFIAIFTLMVLFSQISIFHINSIIVKGTQTINQEDILFDVSNKLEGSYFYFFDKKHALYFSRTDIRNLLTEKYTRIKSVNLNIIGGKTLSVDIVEREPFALWCGHRLKTIISVEMKPDCYFSDKGGYIFDRAPYISDNEFFKIYGTPSVVGANTQISLGASLDKASLISVRAEKSNMIGAQFLPEKIFHSVMQFASILHSEGIESYGLEVALKEAKLHLIGGGVLKFRIDQNLNSILTDLILANRNKKEINEQKLEYIDVRFTNRVLFKYFEETQ